MIPTSFQQAHLHPQENATTTFITEQAYFTTAT